MLNILSGIYIIINRANGKIYIGQTKDFKKRIRDHLTDFRRNVHVNKTFQDDFNKFGEECFEFVFLEQVEDKEERHIREQYYIAKFRSNDGIIGYNLDSGGKIGSKKNDELVNRMKIYKRGSTKCLLTAEQVEQIKVMMANGVSRKEIMEIFGVSRRILTDIAIGKNYAYIRPDLNDVIHNKKQRDLQNRNKIILEKYDSGMTISEICKDMNLSVSIVEKCVYDNRKERKLKYNVKNKKLTEEIISEINKLHFIDGKTTKEIQEIYGFSGTTVLNAYKMFNAE